MVAKAKVPMKRQVKWIPVILIFLLLMTFQGVNANATYRFQVIREEVNLFVNQDGTVSIDYLYEFQNDTGVSAIDYVDIGIPNSNYDLKSITADVNGIAIRDIQKSEYVNPGVALGLGSNAIKAGARGVVRAKIPVVRKMIYKAKTKEKEPYASFQFSPNWFDKNLVRGFTNLTVTLYLPQGLQSEEPRYFPPGNFPGNKDPESNYDSQGRVYYRWTSTNANAGTQYIFGAAFPARLVASSALVSEPLINFGTINWENICPGAFCFGIFIFIVGSTIAGTRAEKKRKLKYLPPKILVEGNGIKRGLTAVEAAILMEQPVDKILTMILFSVLKKSAARVESKNPVKIVPEKTLPEGLYSYEKAFLDAMQTDTAVKQRAALQNMLVDLVKSVGEKMRGFSRKETLAYYTSIIEAAWKQVTAAETPEVQMQKYDESMDWTMLDNRYPDRTREIFGSRPVIVPSWWWRYDPVLTRGTTTAPLGTQGSVPGSVSLPSLPGADFAASVVNGVQSWASGVVGDITNFTSGITNRTNPPPPPSSSSGSSRSGGGGSSCACACACACAGCACACAGGGR